MVGWDEILAATKGTSVVQIEETKVAKFDYLISAYSLHKPRTYTQIAVRAPKQERVRKVMLRILRGLQLAQAEEDGDL